jgi:N,N'-diacetylchitobiose non-reducing end deacetylase
MQPAAQPAVALGLFETARPWYYSQKSTGDDPMKHSYCAHLPLPDLSAAASILCIQPHPDDMEIGAGATIARLAASGTAVSCLTITDGSAGTTDPEINPDDLAKTRRLEAEESAAILGVKNLHWLEYADGGSLFVGDIRAEVTRVIREVKPEAVLVCDPWLPYEAHSDHIRTGLASAEAAFLANMPNFYPEDLQQGLQPHAVKMIAFYYTAYPNTFIEVSGTWEKKMAAVSCHKSQFPPGSGDEFKAYLTAKAAALGREHSCKMAEAIKVLSPAHLHISEDTWRC